MEPSEDTGEPEARRPSDEIGPLDRVPQERPQSLNDISPVNGDENSKDIGPLEEKTSLNDLEQPEDNVFNRELALREDNEPSPHVASETPMPPIKERRQSAVAHEHLREFDGKTGTYVYKPGTSTLVFRQRKLSENLNEGPGETLFKAVRFGQTKAVEVLLGAKEPTEFRDHDDRTPLLYAVEDNNFFIVDLLLRNKADWNARDKWKRTALHIASLNRRPNLVFRLLDIPGIDVNARDEQYETPLHFAARNGHRATVKLLLGLGANVNAKDKKGFTPLHLAAAKRGPSIVEMILSDKNVQVDVRANNGRTPLMQACDRAASEEGENVVELLLDSNADPAACDHNGETPLFLSALIGNPVNLVNLIFSKKRPIDINALTEENRSSLFSPARLGLTPIVELLLDAGIDSRVKDKDGRTAFLESAKYDKVEVLRLIFENLVTKHGEERRIVAQTALFEAAVHDSSQVARFLIEQGASMEEKDPNSQKTAMEIANDHSSQKVVAILLEKGDQLVGQGPSLGDQLQDAPSESEPIKLEMKDSAVDLTFGFQSTIASFPYDTRKKYRIKRPQLRSVLYDHSPEPIQYGLKEAESTSNNFRWLHVPSNNIVWVNKLISRMYKDCHPPEKANYFKEKCKHLFGEEIWTRHQYQTSSTSVAHRRFIRPICQRVPLSDTDDNMMMVLPYIHWETKGGRKEMTDVIVEAMKRHLNDPQPTSTLKGLNEALEELEKIRNTKTIDSDYDSSSYYSSNYSYYNYFYTSTSSSDPKTRSGATKKTNPPEEDIISRVASEALEDAAVHASRAPIEKKVEQEERRKKRIQKIIKVAKESRTPDEKLILAYMFDEIPLHFRRTLDQYYYYTLPTTEARDVDQVVSRYFEKTWPEEEENENLVLMVDQLWLWILDKDTVVTSFPQRWNKSEKKMGTDPDPNNDSDIVESIIRQIGKKDRRPLTNVFDLAELIVSKCIGTMFEHPDIANEKLRFAEFFEISIGNVTNEEAKMFNDFTDLSKRLATDDQNVLNSEELKEDLKTLFDISEETKFVKEIKDIRDELHIISTVLEDQEKVLVDMQEAIHAMKTNNTEVDEPKKLQTTRNAHGLPERVRSYKAVVQGLDKQAEKTYVALKDLLDLKQKQANVSEARTQGKQAAETARQSQTIMLFTIITVFFLPLSFMSSFFDLDISEFVKNGEGELGLGYVSGIMFAVTIGVVAISLFFAFGWELFLAFIAYCKNLLRRFPQGLRKFVNSRIFRVLLGLFCLIMLCVLSPWGMFMRRRRKRREVIIEEISTRRSRSPRRWYGAGQERSAERIRPPSPSDSDEVIIIEEERSPSRRRARSREYRRGRYSSSSRHSMSATRSGISGLLALMGLRLGTGEVTVEERYSRRRSTSPVRRWYGDDERRSSPKRKKWLPWAWFEKSPAPIRRDQRDRDATFRDEPRPTGPKGVYGTFITPLLGLFGRSQRAPERRNSMASSYYSYETSASSRATRTNESSGARSRRTRRS